MRLWSCFYRNDKVLDIERINHNVLERAHSTTTKPYASLTKIVMFSIRKFTLSLGYQLPVVVLNREIV